MGIRGRLLALTLGFAIPLAATGLIGLQWLWSASRGQLDASVRKQAELAAAAFERWIEAERQPLLALAASASGRPNSEPLSPAELRSGGMRPETAQSLLRRMRRRPCRDNV